MNPMTGVLTGDRGRDTGSQGAMSHVRTEVEMGGRLGPPRLGQARARISPEPQEESVLLTSGVWLSGFQTAREDICPFEARDVVLRDAVPGMLNHLAGVTLCRVMPACPTRGLAECFLCL